MPSLKLLLRPDEIIWPELIGADIIHYGHDAPPIQIAALKEGMQGGKTSLMIRLDLPDGRFAMVETSLELFLGAAVGLKAAFPDG